MRGIWSSGAARENWSGQLGEIRAVRRYEKMGRSVPRKNLEQNKESLCTGEQEDQR